MIGISITEFARHQKNRKQIAQ